MHERLLKAKKLFNRGSVLIEKAKAIEDHMVYLLDPMNVELFKSDKVNALTVSKSCSL